MNRKSKKLLDGQLFLIRASWKQIITRLTLMNFYVLGYQNGSSGILLFTVGSSIQIGQNRRFAQMVVTYWKAYDRHLGEPAVLSNLDARTDSVFYNIKFNNVSSGQFSRVFSIDTLMHIFVINREV